MNVTDSFGSITLVLPAGTAAYRVADAELLRQHDRVRAAVTDGQERDHGHNNSGDITIATGARPAVSSCAPRVALTRPRSQARR